MPPRSLRALSGGRIGELARSDTGRAAGMGAAVMGGNVLALLFTVVFARKLGQSGYGSLSALVSTYIILMVPGSAVQTTVAREVSAAVAAGDPRAGAGVWRWIEQLIAVTAIGAAISIVSRHGLATLIGVDEAPWAAAATIPSGCLWLMVSIQRGALQGFHRYSTVGASWMAEQFARIVFAFALVGSGSVTGVFLATPLALAAIALLLILPLRRALPRAGAVDHPFWRLLVRAGAPVAALALVAWMQDGNVIIVKHVATAKEAGLYASAAVAAKAIMWIAVGLGLFLVPEAARRARLRRSAGGVFASTLGLVALVGVPMVIFYALAGTQLMKAAFGSKFADGAAALPWLGVALSLLACTYLAVQYHLALHRWRFIALLAVGAVVQPVVVIAAGPDLVSIAIGLTVVNAALAAAMVVLAFRVAAHPEQVELGEDEAGDAIAPSETLA